LNLAGVLIAAISGRWYLKQIYHYGYLPAFLIVMALGFAGLLPRVKSSTKGEGTERRYFYGAVWAVTTAQTILLVLWKTLPRGHGGDVLKLMVFLISLIAIATVATFGLLPRTRPILPGEMIVAD